jgi:hypothetical protein
MAKARNKVASDIPEGFDVHVGRERGDGWAKKEPGNTIMGRLLGRYSFRGEDGRPRAYYQVRLMGNARAEIPNPEDEDGDNLDVVLEEGNVINIDETASLSDLGSYTEDGGIYDVWFRFGEKVKHKGGKTLWRIDGPKLRVVKPAPRRKDDPIPF